MASEKAYETEVELGCETVSDDAAGETILTRDWAHVTEAMTEAALDRFRGDVLQAPPRVSALKRGGERMYERVRRGEDVDAELEPRPITIHALTLQAFEAPRLTLTVTAGKGFYVRSLARDLGRALETAAHVVTLRRTRIGRFSVADAHDAETVTHAEIVGMAEALAHLPALRVSDAALDDARHGRPIRDGVLDGTVGIDEPVRVLGPDDALLAVAEKRADGAFAVRRGFNG